MNQDIEMLNEISQNAEMGKNGIAHILKMSSNARFNSVLEHQLKEYEFIYNSSNNLCTNYGEEASPVNPMAKMSSYVTSSIKSLVDSSTSNMAEMMIQGSTMGVTKITKQINEYNGSNRQILGLAEKLLETEQNNIEEMKKFL